MSAPATRTARPAPRHDDERLLGLVAAAARRAEADGRVTTAAAVSMRVFNDVRASADQARGVDPDGSDRTPTANAILMHFKARAVREVSWPRIVSAALGTPTQARQWLVATRRPDDAELTPHEVRFALLRVAADDPGRALTQARYNAVADRLRDADHAARGEDGQLAALLPTAAQLSQAAGGWDEALALVGLTRPAARKPARRAPALPVYEVLAHYAALNGVWASYPTLRAFARASAVAMADQPPGGMGAQVHQARALLQKAGLPAPDGAGAKPLGRGKRLTFRYPLAGIPGAPVPSRSPGGAAERAALRDEYAVLSVRIWLAGLNASARKSRAAYVAWQTEQRAWASASRFTWSVVQRRALDANRRDQRQHGTPVPPEVAERAARLQRQLGGANDEPLPFEQAVQQLLATPTGSWPRA